jgi:hypothetical protein
MVHYSCDTADVCYVETVRETPKVDVRALFRLPLPPYVEIQPHLGPFHLGKPLFFLKRPTFRAWLTPSFTLIVSPDENGGGLALKYRF